MTYTLGYPQSTDNLHPNILEPSLECHSQGPTPDSHSLRMSPRSQPLNTP